MKIVLQLSFILLVSLAVSACKQMEMGWDMGEAQGYLENAEQSHDPKDAESAKEKAETALKILEKDKVEYENTNYDKKIDKAIVKDKQIINDANQLEMKYKK